jgi:hypothetical protein
VHIITACPTCGRQISEEWASASAWKGDPAALGKEVHRDATTPCHGCAFWVDSLVAAEPLSLKEGVAVLGAYRSGWLLDWANECAVWARVGSGSSPYAVVEIRDTDTEQGWTARRLLPEHDWEPAKGLLHDTSPVLGGRYLLAVAEWGFWLSEIPPATGKLLSVQRLGQARVFDISPDLEAAALYPPSQKGGKDEPPLYQDLKSGRTERWTAVTTTRGTAWSPRGDYYLCLGDAFRYLAQPVPAGTPIHVSRPDETVFFGQWSPDGSMVAYKSFEGDPSPYLQAPDPQSRKMWSDRGWPNNPRIWEALKVWSMADRQVHRLAVPDRWVLSDKVCWSPDGKAVAFAAGGLKPSEGDELHETWGDVYVSRLGARGWSAPAALTEDGRSGAKCLPVEWSPDGKALLISVMRTTGVQVQARDFWEHRIVRLDGELEPKAGNAVVLEGAWMANWIGTEQLVTLTLGASEHQQLETRSAQGVLLQVLEPLNLEMGQFGRISYQLSPSRTRIAWSVHMGFDDERPPEVWIKVRRLDTQ